VKLATIRSEPIPDDDDDLFARWADELWEAFGPLGFDPFIHARDGWLYVTVPADRVGEAYEVMRAAGFGCGHTEFEEEA
jgi:hypothetical protein